MVPLHTLSAQELNKNGTEEQRVLVEYEEKISKTSINDIKKIGEVQEEHKNLNLVTMNVTENEKQKLENNTNVKKVLPDIKMKINTQDLGYAIPKVKATEAHASKITGKGVKVAVIDSGASSQEDLKIAGGKSFVGYTNSYSDDNGHGTHVAGIISAENNSIGVLGIAPDSEIYSLKAMDKNGNGYVSDLIYAIDWSIENKMDIINLSLGIEDSAENMDTIEYLETFINKAYESGILIVAAAGNDDLSPVQYPAKYDSVIAVSATTVSNTIASFSNRSTTVSRSRSRRCDERTSRWPKT